MFALRRAGVRARTFRQRVRDCSALLPVQRLLLPFQAAAVEFGPAREQGECVHNAV